MDDLYKYIVNISPDFITLINQNYHYEVANSTYCNIVGKEPSEIIGRHIKDVWGIDIFTNIIKKYLDRCFSGEEIHYIEEFKFGIAMKYLHVSYYPYRNEENKVIYALVLSHDITKLGKIESKLANFEFRDPITGLFNKKSLNLIADMELEKAKRSRSEQLRAICIIRIRNLDDVRAKFGTEIANILLENTGIKLKQVLRGTDHIFRFEGNEFIVLLTYLNKNHDTGKVALKLYEEVINPYRHHKADISLTCVIGVSIYPNDGDTFEKLLKCAYSALVEAEKNDCGVLLFDPVIQESSRERISLERDLHNAIYEKQLQLYYQPIVDRNGKICGAESLIRWIHPDKGIIPPGYFIPFAEETGLIQEIGKWVLFTAVRQLEQWRKEYDIYISINLSAKEYENSDLVKVLQGLFENSELLSTDHLKLELTESDQMKNPEQAIEKMQFLNGLGFEIYIDDFGTGLSGLSYLKQLPASTIKIDKMFVDFIAESPGDREFLKNILDMIKNRKKTIIVEGIEKSDQFEILKKLNCDNFQGYYFSKPVSAAEFEQYLQNGGLLPAAEVAK